jgi:hypothetical protein
MSILLKQRTQQLSKPLTRNKSLSSLRLRIKMRLKNFKEWKGIMFNRFIAILLRSKWMRKTKIPRTPQILKMLKKHQSKCNKRTYVLAIYHKIIHILKTFKKRISQWWQAYSRISMKLRVKNHHKVKTKRRKSMVMATITKSLR